MQSPTFLFLSAGNPDTGCCHLNPKGTAKSCSKSLQALRCWHFLKSSHFTEITEGRKKQPNDQEVHFAFKPVFLARDSEAFCWLGFGVDHITSPWGLLAKPSCLARQHCTSLSTRCALRVSHVLRRGQGNAVVTASNSSFSHTKNNPF